MIFTPTMQARKPWQHRPTNDNVQLVATFDGQVPTMPARAYEAELREFEQSRDFRDLDSLMRERSAVRL